MQFKLMKHLLRHANGVRLAVLVNDFGDLPIDAELIEAQDGDVINLSGGCVCCSYGDDLSLSLQKLQALPSQPEHIFIEASGVALPGAIGKSLSLLRAYRLDSIVVLADAATVQSAATQKYIGDTIARQLSDADLIVLNKHDLLTDEQVRSVNLWLDEQYSHTPRIDSVHSTVSPDVLFDLKPGAANAQGFEHVHAADSLFSTLSLSMKHTVDANHLAAQLAQKRHGLVRAKGFVQDTDNVMKTIQVVGRRWVVTPAPEGVTAGLVCIASTDTFCEATIQRLCEPDAQMQT